MNCKPGDLAVIASGEGADRIFIGKIVRVISISQIDPNVCWYYEGPRLVHPWFGEMIGVSDNCLRPIRPGDISDEEVRDLYAPKLPEGIAA